MPCVALRALRRFAAALLGGLPAGPEHGGDLRPRVAVLTGIGHGIGQLGMARRHGSDGGADTAPKGKVKWDADSGPVGGGRL